MPSRRDFGADIQGPTQQNEKDTPKYSKAGSPPFERTTYHGPPSNNLLNEFGTVTIIYKVNLTLPKEHNENTIGQKRAQKQMIMN